MWQSVASTLSSFFEADRKQKEESDFIESIANLPANRQEELKENRRLEQRENRMHAELCSAIRDSKSDVNVKVSRYI
jgi:hypothetical protein